MPSNLNVSEAGFLGLLSLEGEFQDKRDGISLTLYPQELA